MKLHCVGGIETDFDDELLMQDSSRAEIVEALLSYLVENADARDTLEGIVEWWLLDETIRPNAIEVKRVLDDLVAKKLVLERKTGDKRIHYCVNPRKKKEIRALLTRRDA
jgi:hypothetical protein